MGYLCDHSKSDNLGKYSAVPTCRSIFYLSTVHGFWIGLQLVVKLPIGNFVDVRRGVGSGPWVAFIKCGLMFNRVLPTIYQEGYSADP